MAVQRAHVFPAAELTAAVGVHDAAGDIATSVTGFFSQR
jgi:hypothetical protein